MKYKRSYKKLYILPLAAALCMTGVTFSESVAIAAEIENASGDITPGDETSESAVITDQTQEENSAGGISSDDTTTVDSGSADKTSETGSSRDRLQASDEASGPDHKEDSSVMQKNENPAPTAAPLKSTGGTGAAQATEKEVVKNGWHRISGKYYYYKNNVKYTGWHRMTTAEGEAKEHWSYFGKDGALRTGWVQLGKGTAEPDGNTAKHWSYFGDNGWLRTGWVQLGKGTAEPDGNTAKHWSYFGDNGWLRTHWQQLGQNTPNSDGNSPAHFSYFGDNGWLRTGSVSISGKSYTFDSKGWLIIGAVSTSEANNNLGSTAAPGTIADGCYRISPLKNTNYSVDVWGERANDNTKIWSYANNDTAAQFFQIKHLGNNIYSIKTGASIYASGWDISGGKAVAGAALVQKKYTGSSTQKWQIVSAGDGTYSFKPVSGNLVVDIEGGNVSEGALKLAKSTGSSTQKFKLTKASGFLIRNGRKYYFNQNGDKPMIGVDVSAWSETVDWEKVKADGIEFAILRASHRGGQVDKYAARNMSECTRLGIPFGVYCYSYATTNAEADHEVDVLLSVIKGYHPALGVFIDVEDNDTYQAAFGNIYAPYARRKITDLTKRMVSRVQNAGYLAGVYGNDPYMNHILYLDEMPNVRWIARYFNDSPSDTNVISLAGKGYKIWQFTSRGYVNGVPNSGNADLNTLIEKYW